MKRRHILTLVASIVTMFAFDAAASPAWAEVSYSPRYWELLDRYASVEAAWAPVHGVYPGDPESLLAPQPDEPGGSGQAFTYVFLNPDGTLGTSGWVEDPAAPDGWRVPSGGECMSIDWDTVDDPDRWSTACGWL